MLSTHSEAPSQRRTRGTLLVIVSALGLAMVTACGSHTSSQTHEQAASAAADPRTEEVKVADLVPLYRGAPSTWPDVDALKAQGKAQVVYLYADNAGNYAYVFDTNKQFVSWACAPHQPKRALCKEATLMRDKRVEALRSQEGVAP